MKTISVATGFAITSAGEVKKVSSQIEGGSKEEVIAQIKQKREDNELIDDGTEVKGAMFRIASQEVVRVKHPTEGLSYDYSRQLDSVRRVVGKLNEDDKIKLRTALGNAS